MTQAELKEAAALVADAMRAAQEPLPAALRKQFIDVRAVLFARGIYDPVLVRFDSATAPRASVHEVAEQLASAAESLS